MDSIGGRDRRLTGRLQSGIWRRIAPEKGLLGLCEAYVRFRQMPGVASARLEVAGYLAPDQQNVSQGCGAHARRTPASAASCSIAARSTAQQKIEFLRGLDVFSVPTVYVEPKGLFLLEAMACGVPVVQPRHGAFPEMLAQDVWRASRRARRCAESRRRALHAVEGSGAARRARTERIRRRARALQRAPICRSHARGVWTTRAVRAMARAR